MTAALAESGTPHADLSGELLMTSIGHAQRMADIAEQHGWHLAQKEEITTRDAQTTAAIFDNACIEEANRAAKWRELHGRTGPPVTLDEKLLPAFGFGRQPDDVHQARYAGEDGQLHHLVRAAWKTTAPTGLLHTVIYFNFDATTTRQLLQQQAAKTDRMGLGYLRMVYDQPTGDVLSAEQVVAEPVKTKTARHAGRAAVKTRR